MKSLSKIAFALPLVFAAFGMHYAHAETVSESHIAEIMETVNDAEIDVAKTAKSRAEHKDVKEFAKHMISEHEKNNKEGKKVIKSAKIDAEDNTSADNIEADAKKKIDELKKMKGNDFDRAYIGTQVTMHQQVLKDLNEIYIPSAKNPEFKAYLEKTRDHVQQHLTKAQEIQNKLVK